MFFPRHVYKSCLNVLIELRPKSPPVKPGLDIFLFSEMLSEKLEFFRVINFNSTLSNGPKQFSHLCMSKQRTEFILQKNSSEKRSSKLTMIDMWALP